MSVGSRVTERSAPTDIVPPEAHPNSSEISVDRPLLPNEYLWTSRHGGAPAPSSLDVTDRNVSVQTWRFPDVVQLVAALKNDDPFGDVSAATGPAARRSPIEPPRRANLNRRIRHLRPCDEPVSEGSRSTRSSTVTLCPGRHGGVWVGPLRLRSRIPSRSELTRPRWRTRSVGRAASTGRARP